MWERLDPEMTGFTCCDVINDPKSRNYYAFLDISFYYKLTSIKLGNTWKALKIRQNERS